MRLTLQEVRDLPVNSDVESLGGTVFTKIEGDQWIRLQGGQIKSSRWLAKNVKAHRVTPGTHKTAEMIGTFFAGLTP